MQSHNTQIDVLCSYQYLVYILRPSLGAGCQRQKSISAAQTRQRACHTQTNATHTHTHNVSRQQSIEVWSVKWETHQSGRRFQCRATSAGLVVTAAITAAQICC